MPSGRAIDHVVLAVRDLDRAAGTFQGLGFTLTPRAMHEDRMGTSNRLAQFAGRNFIELLEVDRPDRLQPHDLDGNPPFYGFGDHNRRFIERREGLSMLVFASDDARADLAGFEAAGLRTAAPFDFERQATLPDGARITVSFSLAFAWSDAMPQIGFFACQNRAQQYFWKPDYQRHDNGAAGISAVYLASPEPERDAAFVSRLFGGDVTPAAGGFRVACGPHAVLVLAPDAIAALDAASPAAKTETPLLTGLRLRTDRPHPLTPSSDACGAFIEWVA
jgi:hypothetical protein